MSNSRTTFWSRQNRDLLRSGNSKVVIGLGLLSGHPWATRSSNNILWILRQHSGIMGISCHPDQSGINTVFRSSSNCSLMSSFCKLVLRSIFTISLFVLFRIRMPPICRYISCTESNYKIWRTTSTRASIAPSWSAPGAGSTSWMVWKWSLITIRWNWHRFNKSCY